MQVSNFFEEWARECPEDGCIYSDSPDYSSECPYFIRRKDKANDGTNSMGEEA